MPHLEARVPGVDDVHVTDEPSQHVEVGLVVEAGLGGDVVDDRPAGPEDVSDVLGTARERLFHVRDRLIRVRARLVIDALPEVVHSR